MQISKEEYYPLDEDGTRGWIRQLAPLDGVNCVLNGDRSPWYWIRLPDGDLVLACYPQEGPNGTYLQTEQWRTI